MIAELEAKNRELQIELRMRTAAYDIEARLLKAGAIAPGLLAESAKRRFQFGDDGRLANAEALIGEMKRSYPEQFEPRSHSGSIDAAAGRSAAQTLTKDALSMMSPAEIQKLDWAEVRNVLAN